MRHYFIATHAMLSTGMLSAVELIVGKKDHVRCFTGYVNDCDIEADLKDAVNSIPVQDEITIMTDILGGSVNNLVVNFCARPNVHVVTGINLAMVIGILLSDPDEDIRTVIKNAVAEARAGMVYWNEQIDKEEVLEDF